MARTFYSLDSLSDVVEKDCVKTNGTNTVLIGPQSSSMQGTEDSALTRKDYVDSKVAELLQEIATLRSEINTLKGGN